MLFSKTTNSLVYQDLDYINSYIGIPYILDLIIVSYTPMYHDPERYTLLRTKSSWPCTIVYYVTCKIVKFCDGEMSLLIFHFSIVESCYSSYPLAPGICDISVISEHILRNKFISTSYETLLPGDSTLVRIVASIYVAIWR